MEDEDNYVRKSKRVIANLNDVNGGGGESDEEREPQLQILVDGSQAEIVKDRNEDVSSQRNGKYVVKAEEKVDRAVLIDEACWNEFRGQK